MIYLGFVVSTQPLVLEALRVASVYRVEVAPPPFFVAVKIGLVVYLCIISYLSSLGSIVLHHQAW